MLEREAIMAWRALSPAALFLTTLQPLALHGLTEHWCVCVCVHVMTHSDHTVRFKTGGAALRDCSCPVLFPLWLHFSFSSFKHWPDTPGQSACQATGNSPRAPDSQYEPECVSPSIIYFYYFYYFSALTACLFLISFFVKMCSVISKAAEWALQFLNTFLGDYFQQRTNTHLVLQCVLPATGQCIWNWVKVN